MKHLTPETELLAQHLLTLQEHVIIVGYTITLKYPMNYYNLGIACDYLRLNYTLDKATG